MPENSFPRLPPTSNSSLSHPLIQTNLVNCYLILFHLCWVSYLYTTSCSSCHLSDLFRLVSWLMVQLKNLTWPLVIPWRRTNQNPPFARTAACVEANRKFGESRWRECWNFYLDRWSSATRDGERAELKFLRSRTRPLCMSFLSQRCQCGCGFESASRSATQIDFVTLHKSACHCL